MHKNVENIFSEIIDKRKKESPLNKEKHMHCCAAVYKKTEILAYGKNFHIVGVEKTEHSEVNCLKQIDKIGRKRIDLFVARTNWLNSRPCIHCIKNMVDSVKKNNIKINNIYYTIDKNSFAKYRLSELVNDKNHYISSYNRNINGLTDDSSTDDELETCNHIFNY